MDPKNDSFDRMLADINGADLVVQASDIAQMLADEKAAGEEEFLAKSIANDVVEDKLEKAEAVVKRLMDALTNSENDLNQVRQTSQKQTNCLNVETFY